MEETIYLVYEKRKFEYGRWSYYVQIFKVSSPYKICRLYNLIMKSRFPYMRFTGVSITFFGLFKELPC